jgi:DNA-binding NtrC family response regulator
LKARKALAVRLSFGYLKLMAKILIVEDDPDQALAALRGLKESGHTVQMADAVASGIKLLQKMKPEIVITDLMLGDESGLEVLAAARREEQFPDVIVVTAHPTSDTAAEAMQGGAYEYLSKPFVMADLRAQIQSILERRSLMAESRRKRSPKVTRADDMIVESPAMKELLQNLQGALLRTTTLLLRGESGSGKEALARYIHEHGAHAEEPFVAINCAALPENLLGSELFGHEKGAFTGADNQRKGAFERAGSGTLLLDEIGDIPLATQVHLLRALENREIQRVGGDETIPVQARVICATHRNLEQMVSEKTFRQDLFFRINVFPIAIPPLRHRPEDIAALTARFLLEFDAPAELIPLKPFIGYSWPGNVRELRNIVENLVIRSFNQEITERLVSSLLLPPIPAPQAASSGAETLTEMEIRKIREAIAQAGGNKSKAATALGITRRKLYSRMKVLGIEEAE